MSKYRFNLMNQKVQTNDYPDIFKNFAYTSNYKAVNDILTHFEITMDQFKDGSFPPLFERIDLTYDDNSYYTPHYFIVMKFLDYKLKLRLDNVHISLSSNVPKPTDIHVVYALITGSSITTDRLSNFLNHLRNSKKTVLQTYRKYNDPDYIKKRIDALAKKEGEISFLLKEDSSI